MATDYEQPKGIAEQAHAIYDAEIRHLVEPEHHGEYLTLDVKTGEYEIDADDLAAIGRMLERHPAENLFIFRIGYPAFGAFGWRLVLPSDQGKTMKPRFNPLQGIGGQAEAIYDAEIRHLVEPEHHGEYLTLDVKTGEYEIDADDMAVMDRMLERHSPENLFTFRIGYPAFGTFVGWQGVMP